MSELQGIVAGWLSGLAAVLPIGFAFGAGIVAAVNPCGFAMLPAYLSLYLGVREEAYATRSWLYRALRALVVGATVSAGFILLFAVAGVITSVVGQALVRAMPPVGLLIGILLGVLGLWMLVGGGVYLPVFQRLAGRIGGPGSVNTGGFFVFGLAYGAASLSCTLPVFLLVVGGGIAAGNLPLAVGQFFSYALGMALVIMTLTLTLALLKGGLVSRFRKAMRYIQPVSALLLMGAGAYMILYWWTPFTRML